MFTGSVVATAVNLNGPGRYLHWSIFIVSEANLVLIAVMVVIFGAALLIPFPGHAKGEMEPLDEFHEHAGNGTVADITNRSSSASDLGDDADAAMWTSRM